MTEIIHLKYLKFDIIKNSKFYDILKDFDILKMTSEQEEELKIFILSLSDEEIDSVMIKIIDDDYCNCSTIYEHKKNKKMKEFLSDLRFEKILERILYVPKNY